MKTFDLNFEDQKGEGKIRRKKGNSNLQKLNRYIASLNNEQIMRMVADSGKPYLPKGADVVGRSIYQNSITSKPHIQMKLEISQSQDKSELQADKVAEGVTKGDTNISKSALEQNVSDINTKSEGGAMTTTPEFDQQLQGTKGQGQKLGNDVKTEMEGHLNTDLSGVNIHTSGEAKNMSEGINAKAFTHGQDVYFNEGKYNPSSNEGKSLLAHELTHTVQQSEGKVQPKIQRQAIAFPFIGYIKGANSVALRSKPIIDKADKYKYIDYDLPKGYEVTVISSNKGFYYVSTKAPDNHISGIKAGDKVNGYVSHELISQQQQKLTEFDTNLLKKDVLSIDDAMLLFTSAKLLKTNQHVFTTYENSKLEQAKKVLEATKKYTVDMTKYEVLFETKSGKKPTITTIQDFILFVEDVERNYPSSSPSEIVSEIRQMWNSGENWAILVASQGITNAGKTGKDKYVNIEDKKANPIAKKYDLDKQLGAAEGGSGKQITINGVKVDIGHLIAGLDASLSGTPSKFPKQFLTDAKYITDDSEDKYNIMKEQSGGEVRDFTTWAGDIGQAYAEFLAGKYINSDKTSFKTFFPTKAGDDELNGDIHGFIAKQVWEDMDKSKLATGKNDKISDILKTLYLQDKTKSGTELSYKKQFSKIIGTKLGVTLDDNSLKSVIRERSLKFAKPWFVKKAYEYRNWAEVIGGPWAPDSALKEFDKMHKKNVESKVTDDQIDILVDYFIKMLDGSLKK